MNIDALSSGPLRPHQLMEPAATARLPMMCWQGDELRFTIKIPRVRVVTEPAEAGGHEWRIWFTWDGKKNLGEHAWAADLAEAREDAVATLAAGWLLADERFELDVALRAMSA
jgi:hypothetical protein